MNKSEFFKLAHKRASAYEGNYQACFQLAIKEIKEELLNDYVFNSPVVTDKKTKGSKKLTLFTKIKNYFTTSNKLVVNTLYHNVNIMYKGV